MQEHCTTKYSNSSWYLEPKKPDFLKWIYDCSLSLSGKYPQNPAVKNSVPLWVVQCININICFKK